MLGRFAIVGAVALLVGVLIGMLVLAMRPVEQPAIAVIPPIGSENARRVVVVNPKSGSVNLYEVSGTNIQELGSSRY